MLLILLGWLMGLEPTTTGITILSIHAYILRYSGMLLGTET
jgi:hypothetical protein